MPSMFIVVSWLPVPLVLTGDRAQGDDNKHCAYSKVLRSESVKCPVLAVIAMSRARHVHVMSLNLLTSRKSPLV